MTNRPPLGARVRLLGNTGIPAVNGRTGRVVWHHAGGVAFAVELDVDRARLICDPENVELADGHPPYVSSGDAQPARTGVRP